MAMFWTLIFVIWKTNEITWIMEGMEGIANKPMWHLECNISEDAARLSYETMSGKKVEE